MSADESKFTSTWYPATPSPPAMLIFTMSCSPTAGDSTEAGLTETVAASVSTDPSSVVPSSVSPVSVSSVSPSSVSPVSVSSVSPSSVSPVSPVSVSSVSPSSVSPSSVVGTVTEPSAVVTSNALAAASEIITFDNVIEDAFCSTTSNVTVASVPSPSDVPAREVAAS